MESIRRRIDVHAHIGHFEGYDLSESTLLSEIERGDIELALISNIDGAAVGGKTRDLDEGAANRATAETVRRFPDRFRGLLWGRPGSGTREALEPFRSLTLSGADRGRWTRRIFVGIKLHPEMNHFEADHDTVDPYLEFARDAGFPVVIHSDGSVDRASARRIIALARRHPEVPVVLYHTAFGGPYTPVIHEAARTLGDGSADLYLETAQLPPDVAVEAVERVGAERVLFGTDATYYGPGHYERYTPLIEALGRRLSPAELEAVLRGNALRVFGLEDRPDTPGSSDARPPGTRGAIE